MEAIFTHFVTIVSGDNYSRRTFTADKPSPERIINACLKGEDFSLGVLWTILMEAVAHDITQLLAEKSPVFIP